MIQNYNNDQPHGSSNQIKKVAVVGATGQMGRHIVESLLNTGKHDLTIITRVNSTIEDLKGVHVVRVDYSGDENPELVQALKGQQILIVTMAVTAPRDTVSKLVRAAAKAGVPYIMPNWFGHDSANDSLCDDSLLSGTRDNVCAEIERLGVSSYLHLVCNFWYEFSLGGGPDRFGFDFPKRSLTLFDGGNVPINTSTWVQCGRAVANLLSLKEFPDNETDKAPTLSQFLNRPVYISSFRLSQRDVFESVKRVTNTTDEDWTITHDSAEQRWKDGRAALANGDWNMFPKMLYSRMFFDTGDADYQSSRGLHNDLLGLPVEDLDAATAIAVRMGENVEVPDVVHAPKD